MIISFKSPFFPPPNSLSSSAIPIFGNTFTLGKIEDQLVIFLKPRNSIGGYARWQLHSVFSKHECNHFKKKSEDEEEAEG